LPCFVLAHSTAISCEVPTGQSRTKRLRETEVEDEEAAEDVEEEESEEASEEENEEGDEESSEEKVDATKSEKLVVRDEEYDDEEEEMSREKTKKKVVDLTDHLQTLNLSSRATTTVEEFPAMPYVWRDERMANRCTVEILLFSGTTVDRVRASVEDQGKTLKIELAYPEIFLVADRLKHAAGVGRNHSRHAGLDVAIGNLLEKHKTL